MDGEVRATQEAKAEMRIKYGIEQAIYHLRSAVNNRVAFLLDTFLWRRKEKYLVCVRYHRLKRRI